VKSNGGSHAIPSTTGIQNGISHLAYIEFSLDKMEVFPFLLQGIVYLSALSSGFFLLLHLQGKRRKRKLILIHESLF
jgi:hypothetical protein